jgi:hypothetical protein
LGNHVVLKLLNAGGGAKEHKRRGSRTSISLKKTVNLLDIKMNAKKDKRKMKGSINVETKINMKKKVNTMLQVER